MNWNLNRDLKNSRWIYLKALLFALILLCTAVLLLLLNPHWLTAVLVLLLIWSSALVLLFLRHRKIHRPRVQIFRAFAGALLYDPAEKVFFKNGETCR